MSRHALWSSLKTSVFPGDLASATATACGMAGSVSGANDAM